MGDVPAHEQNIATCVATAARHYGADGERVLAHVRLRDGKSGEIRVLPNGDFEVGLARIPGKEIPALEKNHGITAKALADDDCLNVTIATYLYQRDALAAVSRTGGEAGAGKPANAALGRIFDQMGSVPARSSMPGDACEVSAAARYSLPLPLFQAVLKTEGGWDGLKKPNTNGSFDLGRAQINTIHLPELKRYGITEHALIHDPCTNLHVAAYRLRFEINRAGELWRGVGNYHSRTPHLNSAYQKRVKRHLDRITASR